MDWLATPNPAGFTSFAMTNKRRRERHCEERSDEATEVDINEVKPEK
jgi:hypothetical protein